MHKTYLIAAGLLLALAGAAQAGPHSSPVGGGGLPPPGLSEGKKTGFDTPGQPNGWSQQGQDQGQGQGAAWKDLAEASRTGLAS
jgi:hypothetical protein